MKIAMLARNAGLYSHQRLAEAARARGHEIDILNTLRVTMNITSHRPEAYYQGERIKRYDAVIPRIGASVTFYGLAVLRQFEMMTIWSLNESVAKFSRAKGWACRSPLLRTIRARPAR